MKLAPVVLLVLAILPAAGPDEGADAGWPQWGGPGRDFRAASSGLAASWPDEGPAELWSRALGEGHSAILYDAGRLYTMHRPSDGGGALEAVVCLDASTGRTLWEYRYEAPYRGLPQYGAGPRATPLLVGDRLFTVGVTGLLHALDTRDGSVLWRHDLLAEPFEGTPLGHGYSSSPLAWGDTVILQVGGEGAALVAFAQETGEVRWRRHSFANSHSSPRLVELTGPGWEGRSEQLLAFMREELIGVDPADGSLLWRWPHANQWGHNIAMPSVSGDIVFFSSPQAGARGLRLSPAEGGVDVEPVWSSRRIQLYHATTVQEGDWVFGSIGTVAPAFMIAVNVRTGEIGWRERGFAKANCIGADGRLLILDEDGVLYLADATPEELVVRASAQLLGRYAWTVPTLVGSTLYARDQRRIVAVDLGRAGT